MQFSRAILPATLAFLAAACSQSTQDNAQNTLDSAAADTRATLEVAGDKLEKGAAKVDQQVNDFQDDVEARRAGEPPAASDTGEPVR